MSGPRITFNNQNTVLLSMILPSETSLHEENHENMLCLLHDNRIFSFKKDFIDDLSKAVESTSSPEQNIILNMLTTPKYRAMSAMYMLFHILDSVLFLSIIVLCLFTDRTLSPNLGRVSICIYIAIGMEIFYDMMLNINRYWLLQRLSIHIGLTLYAIYATLVFTAISLVDKNDTKQLENLNIIKDILLVRFISFVMEECVDVAIDFSLHNDLVRLYDKNRRTVEQELNLETQRLLREPGRLTSFTNVVNFISLPEELGRQYNGSCFAWSTASVFTKGIWRKQEVSQFWIILLCLLPGLITVLLVSMLLLICLFASIIPIMFAFIIRFLALCCSDARGKKRSAFRSYWREMTYF
eukprot:Phypoly_transcript_11970.p1 GENE.Phypoly_transcript_11970~~Phypoly_transcript_11970.p1  ORF type:complete len:354 (+),score=15.03 Phypoly_transcript_11970:73-1134(+)